MSDTDTDTRTLITAVNLIFKHLLTKYIKQHLSIIDAI